jgi:hypothetical protein
MHQYCAELLAATKSKIINREIEMGTISVVENFHDNPLHLSKIEQESRDTFVKL